MLAMVFKLCQAAAAKWRRLQGYKLVAEVIRDVRFIDGVLSWCQASRGPLQGLLQTPQDRERQNHPST